MSLTTVSSRRLILSTLLAAIVAGLVSWGIGETKAMWATAKEVPMMTMGTAHMGATEKTKRDAEIATAARMYGVFGGTLGLALGAAGGLTRRSPRHAAVAALLGACLGVLAGLAASYVAIPLYFRYSAKASDDLIASMLLHGSLWVAIGASAGLALAFGLGGSTRVIVRSLLAGAIGALVGAAAFEMSGAAFYANAQTGDPISSTSGSRLLARLLGSIFVAMGVLTANIDRHRTKSTEASNPLSS